MNRTATGWTIRVATGADIQKDHLRISHRRRIATISGDGSTMEIIERAFYAGVASTHAPSCNVNAPIIKSTEN